MTKLTDPIIKITVGGTETDPWREVLIEVFDHENAPVESCLVTIFESWTGAMIDEPFPTNRYGRTKYSFQQPASPTGDEYVAISLKGTPYTMIKRIASGYQH